MATMLLRAAARGAVGRRRTFTSSATAPRQHGGRQPDDKLRIREADAILTNFDDTKMNVAKKNLLMECIKSLNEDREKTTVIGNAGTIWTVFALGTFAYVCGTSLVSFKARSEKNGAQSTKAS